MVIATVGTQWWFSNSLRYRWAAAWKLITQFLDRGGKNFSNKSAAKPTAPNAAGQLLNLFRHAPQGDEVAVNRSRERDSPRQDAAAGLVRNAANLQRRSRLRRLDDLLEALEGLNLRDAPVLSAAVAERLDSLGIKRSPVTAPFTKLIDGVLAAQEPFMIHLPADRRRPSRAAFDPTKLRF
jgi:hypothetical protein